MGKILNLIGEKYSNITVLSPAGSRKGRRTWLCQCDCNRQFTCSSRDLREKRRTSCGCGIGIHPNTKYHNRDDALISDRISKYKAAAKERSFVWQLSFEECKLLLLGDCHYCNSPPSMNLIYRWTRKQSREYTHKKASTIFTTVNGIDRIDNNQGYINNNCVTCCTRCNLAKNNDTLDVFIGWIQQTYNHLKASGFFKE